MISQWIAANKAQLDSIRRDLLKKDMENSHPELPLMPIYRLLNGAEAEITRLQNHINLNEAKIKELEKISVPHPHPEETEASVK